MNTSNKTLCGSLWAGVVAALASSLCCITPVLAALAGVGSLAGSFRWLDPARPWLLGFSALALGFAWYLKLRPAKLDDCACEVPEKRSIFQRTGFLVAVTIFAIAASAFPLYAGLFQQSPPPTTVSAQTPVQRVVINVKGMTCEACEGEVNGALRKLPGVANASTSYKEATTTVTYNPATTNMEQLMAAIDSTGYTATGTKKVNQ